MAYVGERLAAVRLVGPSDADGLLGGVGIVAAETHDELVTGMSNRGC